jgi:integrase
MHDKVLESLRTLKNNYPFSANVFCKPDGSPVKDLSESFENAAEHAGLRTAKRKLRIYDLRHTAITRLGMLLCNEVQIASVSGHKTLSVLRRYTHFPAEYKRQVINKIGAKVVQQKSRKSSIS